LGDYTLHCEGNPPLLVTENDTNDERIFGKPNTTPYVKDAINSYLVAGRLEAVNPYHSGTKAAAHYQVNVAVRCTAVIRLRLSSGTVTEPFGNQFDRIVDQRRREADEFYQAKMPPRIGEDAANVLRQAYAGMLWSKQHFFLDANKWLEEHGADPMHRTTRIVRNREWFHMVSDDVFSMPDKWEYPWFAAWDLAFHALALSMVDVDFAKQQLDLLLDQVYLHPTGQIPAYEWNFSDVNPPVHAFAAIFLYRTEQALHGRTDLDFLKRVFGVCPTEPRRGSKSARWSAFYRFAPRRSPSGRNARRCQNWSLNSRPAWTKCPSCASLFIRPDPVIMVWKSAASSDWSIHNACAAS
jgi:hypothetical protein